MKIWAYLVGGKWILAGAAVLLVATNTYTFFKAQQLARFEQIVSAAKDNSNAVKGKEKIDAKTRTMDDAAADSQLDKHGWMRKQDN